MVVPIVPQAAPGDTSDKADQCIFFHYYKAKRRPRMEAGANSTGDADKFKLEMSTRALSKVCIYFLGS